MRTQAPPLHYFPGEPSGFLPRKVAEQFGANLTRDHSDPQQRHALIDRGDDHRQSNGDTGSDARIDGLSRVLLNSIGEGVGIVIRDGTLVWSNDLIRRLSGSMLERIAATVRSYDRDHPAPPPGVAPRDEGPTPTSTTLLVDDDKTYQASVSPLAGAEGLGVPAGCVVVVVTDVTAARSLRQKIDAIDQAGSELVRFDADVVRKHNAHERLKLLETKIIKYASTLLHFDHFAIRLLDERANKLELVIGYNLPPDYDAFVIRPSLEGNGISGHVAASGRSYVCNNIAADTLYLPGVEGAKSSLTVPLRVHDKVIGIMNVESLTLGAFTEEDRQLGEIFARYIALAMHMLNLLVVERSATNQNVAGRVEFELNEPLEDIIHEVEILQTQTVAENASVKSHLSRIMADIESIRTRVKECAAGPQTLLGVEKALADKTTDPLLRGKRVLIADDASKIRRIIGDVLSMRGCIVTVCEHGGEAITALGVSPGGFDLVLSDIMMPDHNGYEVFAAARKHCPGVPVILMTGFGYDPHHSIVRAHEEGLQSVLFKPFQVERLLDEVRKALKPADGGPSNGG